MICIIYYELKNMIAGAIIIDGDISYAVARHMIPENAKYKGMHKIEKLDMKIGTRLVNEPNIK